MWGRKPGTHPPLHLSPPEQPTGLQRLPAQPSGCSTCHVPASCRGGPARELLKHNPRATAAAQPHATCGTAESRRYQLGCTHPVLRAGAAHILAHLLGRPAPCRAQAACLSRQRAAHVWSWRCPPLGHRLRPSGAQEGLSQVVMHRQGSMVGPWRLRIQVRGPCRTDADSTRARGGLGKIAQSSPKMGSG